MVEETQRSSSGASVSNKDEEKWTWQPVNGKTTSTGEAIKPPIKLFYKAEEVALHTTADSCWLSLLGHVYDITRLLQEQDWGALAAPILSAAGTDVSHWFDPDTGDVRTHVDSESNLETYYMPQGRFIHVPPAGPSSAWKGDFAVPWWRDRRYRIGRLSSKLQTVRIKNVMTEQEDTMEVPIEETIVEIRERYLERNAHARSYTWKAMRDTPDNADKAFVPLDMEKTLQENGIADESAVFNELGLPGDSFSAVIHLYYTDDLTVA